MRVHLTSHLNKCIEYSEDSRLQKPDDVNLLLAHSHRFVLFLILLPSRQQQPREESAFLALYWKRIMRNSIGIDDFF